MPTHHPNLTIFSGGSAANSLVDVFESVRQSLDCPLSYIIPISDNGGSSSELIRVFGGPGIGDVRSRLVRLIPRLPYKSPGVREREAIRTLFNHRLSTVDGEEARRAWWAIVDGTSALWRDVSSAKKELIRSIFNLVNLEVIKRSRPPGSTFDFSSASVGNLFLTGARLFTGSFESAIYLLGSICGVSDEEVKVIPSINSNFSHHIAAGLEDGSVIVGQNAISHPSPVVEETNGRRKGRGSVNGLENDGVHDIVRRESLEHYYGDEERGTEDEDHEEEDANLPGTLPTLRTRNINFNKAAHLNDDLPARISRIWYINPYGQEILPPANPRAIAAINNAQAIIYSIGSLYTSLVPNLVLRGVGDALRRNPPGHNHQHNPRIKILILNGSLDREVGPRPPSPSSGGTIFSALDFIEAIVRAGEQSRGIIWEADRDRNISLLSSINGNNNNHQTPQQQRHSLSSASVRPGLFTSRSEYTTTTLRSPDMGISISASAIHRHAHHLFPPPLLASTAPTRSPSREPSPSSSSSPPPSHSRNGIAAPDPIYTAYVTHLLHLPNSSMAPHVDTEMLLSKYGIRCVQVKAEEGGGEEKGTRYDPESLREAIQSILK